MTEEAKLRCEGFLGGTLGFPVQLPEVRMAEPEDLRQEMEEMIEDALSGRQPRTWQKLLRPAEHLLERKVLGALSQKVLGIYTQRIFSDHQGTILLSRDAISRVASSWQVDEEELLLWVLSHEGFHSVQFDPSFPLQAEMRNRAASLLSKEGKVQDLVAAMTWIEGSADWIMDRPGLLDESSLQVLRNKMSARRQEKLSFWMRVFRAKRQQYEQGRKMVARAWEEIGPESILLPIQNPELLPRADEITRTDLWIARLQE